MSKSICVFCASSDVVDGVYAEAARDLGNLIAERGDTLVYGGGNIGLMGILAQAVHGGGGRVIGIIPEFMKERDLAYEEADELVLCGDMRERKTIMAERSVAFVALPGGLGTLEELLEVLTLKQLHQHDKPIVLINTAGFYDTLARLFDEFVEKRFAKAKHRGNCRVAATPDEALRYIDTYNMVAGA